MRFKAEYYNRKTGETYWRYAAGRNEAIRTLCQKGFYALNVKMGFLGENMRNLTLITMVLAIIAIGVGELELYKMNKGSSEQVRIQRISLCHIMAYQEGSGSQNWWLKNCYEKREQYKKEDSNHVSE